MRNLFIVLMLLFAACNKEYTPVTSPLNLVIDCEDRVYEFSTPIEFTLNVEDSSSAESQFLLIAEPASAASMKIFINGEDAELGVEQLFDYEIINSSGSKAQLHITVTPTIDAVAAQTCTIDFRAYSVDKKHSAAKLLQLDIANTAEIKAISRYPQTPQKIEEPVDIVLFGAKEGYAGSFQVTPTILEGSGFFQIEDANYTNGEVFSIIANTYITLSYQPLTAGAHKINLLLTDNLMSAELDINLDIYDKYGTSTPGNGIYIYHQGVYYSKEQWQFSAQLQAEGVAVVADQCSFLIGRGAYYGKWGNINAEIWPQLDLWLTADNAEVINDFSGDRNTRALYPVITSSSSTPALVASCHNHDSMQPGKWYMPTGGQLNLVCEHFTQINELSQVIGATTFTKLTNFNYYSSSTIDKTYYRPCVFKILSGTCTSYSGQQYAFPVCDLK